MSLVLHLKGTTDANSTTAHNNMVESTDKLTKEKLHVKNKELPNLSTYWFVQV